jgi:hypothetical protein
LEFWFFGGFLAKLEYFLSFGTSQNYLMWNQLFCGQVCYTTSRQQAEQQAKIHHPQVSGCNRQQGGCQSCYSTLHNTEQTL